MRYKRYSANHPTTLEVGDFLLYEVKWTSSDSSIAEVTNCIGVQSFHNRKATLLISVISYQERTVKITGTALNNLTSSCIVTISK